MSDEATRPGTQAETLGLASVALRQDAICERFESGWRAGPRPSIEELLADAPAAERPGLLHELILLEVELRRESGESPLADEYERRFPRHRPIPTAAPARPTGPDRPAEPLRAPHFAVDGPAARPGRFRILRFLAEGGLGAVYVARDEELGREVALKTIKGPHQGDPDSRGRFLLEAEVTGGLEHPGIVPVYGLDRGGGARPSYAMRLIRGESLKDAVARFHRGDDDPARDPRERSRGARELLRRFVDVCNAVAYAHSRGVLHRDLKPANVMLGPYGETLVVDWGLAKVVGRADILASGPQAGGPVEETLRAGPAGGSTPTRSAVGTPAYMSPEQASADLERLGPRSDVYSLGAILYGILAGRPPIEGGDLHDKLGRAIRGEFPGPCQVKPAAPAALGAVCLKAMALRPEGRYETARDLADEVEHWLADEPVSAYRDPASERIRRWMRSHRSIVAAAAVGLVVAMAALLVVAVVQSRANAATTRALAEATRAREATAEALAESEKSREQAEAVGDFLVEAFRSPDPSNDGLEVKVVSVLDRASARLDEQFSGSDLTRAAMLKALGRTYTGLGLYHRAAVMLAEALRIQRAELGSDDLETLRTINALAVAENKDGRTAEALALHEEALRIREAKLGTDHPETLRSRGNLAVAYVFAERFGDAVALHRVNIKLFEAKLGPDHPDTLHARSCLGNALVFDGRSSEGISTLEKALRGLLVASGPDHPDTLATRTFLANAYFDAGRFLESVAEHQEALGLKKNRLGLDHPDTLTSMNNLAIAYRQVGRRPEALAIHEEDVRLRTAKHGPDHPRTLASRSHLAGIYEETGRWAEAEAVRRDILDRRRKAGDVRTLATANELAGLGRNLLRQSRAAEAEPALRESLAIHEAATSPAWRKFEATGLLGRSLLEMGRPAEAEPLMARGYEGMKARESTIPAHLKSRIRELGESLPRLYESLGRPAEADRWRREVQPR